MDPEKDDRQAVRDVMSASQSEQVAAAFTDGRTRLPDDLRGHGPAVCPRTG